MHANSDQVLTRRTAALLILIGGAAFCGFLILSIVIDPADRTVTGSSSYSRSAVGHAALASLLREVGYDVHINRSRSGRGIAAGDVLLVLEPNLRLNSDADLQRLIEGKRRVLVALPKWQTSPGVALGTPHAWIGAARLLPESAAAAVARGLADPADVERPESNKPWTDHLGIGAPTIDNDLQLIAGARVAPLVFTEDGILAGEVSGGQVIVLSDPDLVTNHGLHRGQNARLALGLIERLQPTTDATIHFDESLHGFAIVPSLPRLLFTPPFIAATLLVLGAVAITIWRAAVGFGKPHVSDNARPVFGSGHETLLRNAGRLLAAGDHAAYIADRYGTASLEEAARRFHLGGQGPRRGGDKGGDDTDLRGMLQGIGRRRGVKARLPDAATQRPLAKARRYYDWMEEMFHGPGPDRDAR